MFGTSLHALATGLALMHPRYFLIFNHVCIHPYWFKSHAAQGQPFLCDQSRRDMLLQVACVLLPLSFAYDVFWVFIQPRLTHGDSVMVEVCKHCFMTIA